MFKTLHRTRQAVFKGDDRGLKGEICACCVCFGSQLKNCTSAICIMDDDDVRC